MIFILVARKKYEVIFKKYDICICKGMTFIYINI